MKSKARGDVDPLFELERLLAGPGSAWRIADGLQTTQLVGSSKLSIENARAGTTGVNVGPGRPGRLGKGHVGHVHQMIVVAVANQNGIYIVHIGDRGQKPVHPIGTGLDSTHQRPPQPRIGEERIDQNRIVTTTQKKSRGTEVSHRNVIEGGQLVGL